MSLSVLFADAGCLEILNVFSESESG